MTEILHLNLNFFDFARYYGFEIVASPPYWPRNKGKVESSVKYVRNHFMQGVKFTKGIPSLEELNKQTCVWIDRVANNRIHATTKEKPRDRWLKEEAHLKFPNGLPDYQVSPVLVRFSTKDQFIQYKQNFYSVPKAYAWRKLFIREVNLQGNKLVNIYFQDKLIAQHNLCTERGKSIENFLHFKQDFKPIKYNQKSWKNYPEIPIRPFDYYDQLLKN
ncbi:transposase [Candidatus Daviesbacteria bacterium]|nr:transposase [Candidatus Daviesbacteria bacterium]